MTMTPDFLNNPAYDFLRTSPNLGERLCYLTLGGSYAYGTFNEASDIDLRGVAVEGVNALLGNRPFEQYVDEATDTVIYALRRFIALCRDCNPNMVELLGTRDEDVLYMNDIGRTLRDHAGLFLSKRAYLTFSGYATAQLRRLQNALAHDSYPEQAKLDHIRKSLDSMMLFAREQYSLERGNITFALPEDTPQATDILTSVHIDNVPLRKFMALNSSIRTMVRAYDKLNHRNKKKDVPHLRKHAMHLIRLYITAIDILRGEGVHTYREAERPLLLSIRNGDTPLDEVFAMAERYERELQRAYAESALPDEPDDDAINELQVDIYKKWLGI